jgi:hypothetical protein
VYLADEVGPANAAMEAGRYAEAAALYERGAIASFNAKEMLQLKMCAALAIKAYAMAGDGANATRFARSTIDALKSRPPEIPGFMRKVLVSMRDHGLPAEADAVSAYVGEVLGAAWQDPNTPKLPAFCSACGAPVKPAEVVRPTPSTVACKFCGASLDR